MRRCQRLHLCLHGLAYHNKNTSLSLPQNTPTKYLARRESFSHFERTCPGPEKPLALGSRAHLSERTVVCCCCGRAKRRERRREGKKKAERRSRPSFYSVPCSSGMERRGEEGGKKNEEDNACSRVGAVLNGNRLASEVPGSWVTWRQGDTVAPPTVRWICRLAARLPQGRSFRVGVDPSGRRDARTPPTPAEPWRGKKSGCTTATVLPCRFRAAAFTLRG